MTRNQQQESAITLIVDEKWQGTRLDKALAEELEEVSRSQIQRWIEEGNVQVNGEVVRNRYKLFANDRIDIETVASSIIAENNPQDIDIKLVFQDEHLIILDKEKGMVVHPGAGNPEGTLMNAVLFHFPETQHLVRGGIVHRLDKDTSGLMVVARTEVARLALIEMLSNHTILREYEAIVVGNPISGGFVNQPIARDTRNRKRMAVHPNGKEAITHYRVLERLMGYSRVRLRLETGRTHQIRVHMKHLGFVLVGDKTYGYRPKVTSGMSDESVEVVRNYTGQALHSRRIQFTHPITGGNIDYKARNPNDMEELLCALRVDEDWKNDLLDDDEWGDYEALWSEEGQWLE